MARSRLANNKNGMLFYSEYELNNLPDAPTEPIQPFIISNSNLSNEKISTVTMSKNDNNLDEGCSSLSFLSQSNKINTKKRKPRRRMVYSKPRKKNKKKSPIEQEVSLAISEKLSSKGLDSDSSGDTIIFDNLDEIYSIESTSEIATNLCSTKINTTELGKLLISNSMLETSLSSTVKTEPIENDLSNTGNDVNPLEVGVPDLVNVKKEPEDFYNHNDGPPILLPEITAVYPVNEAPKMNFNSSSSFPTFQANSVTILEKPLSNNNLQQRKQTARKRTAPRAAITPIPMVYDSTDAHNFYMGDIIKKSIDCFLPNNQNCSNAKEHSDTLVTHLPAVSTKNNNQKLRTKIKTESIENYVMEKNAEHPRDFLNSESLDLYTVVLEQNSENPVPKRESTPKRKRTTKSKKNSSVLSTNTVSNKCILPMISENDFLNNSAYHSNLSVPNNSQVKGKNSKKKARKPYKRKVPKLLNATNNLDLQLKSESAVDVKQKVELSTCSKDYLMPSHYETGNILENDLLNNTDHYPVLSGPNSSSLSKGKTIKKNPKKKARKSAKKKASKLSDSIDSLDLPSKSTLEMQQQKLELLMCSEDSLDPFHYELQTNTNGSNSTIILKKQPSKSKKRSRNSKKNSVRNKVVQNITEKSSLSDVNKKINEDSKYVFSALGNKTNEPYINNEEHVNLKAINQADKSKGTAMVGKSESCATIIENKYENLIDVCNKVKQNVLTADNNMVNISAYSKIVSDVTNTNEKIQGNAKSSHTVERKCSNPFDMAIQQNNILNIKQEPDDNNITANNKLGKYLKPGPQFLTENKSNLTVSQKKIGIGVSGASSGSSDPVSVANENSFLKMFNENSGQSSYCDNSKTVDVTIKKEICSDDECSIIEVIEAPSKTKSSKQKKDPILSRLEDLTSNEILLSTRSETKRLRNELQLAAQKPSKTDNMTSTHKSLLKPSSQCTLNKSSDQESDSLLKNSGRLSPQFDANSIRMPVICIKKEVFIDNEKLANMEPSNFISVQDTSKCNFSVLETKVNNSENVSGKLSEVLICEKFSAHPKKDSENVPLPKVAEFISNASVKNQSHSPMSNLLKCTVNEEPISLNSETFLLSDNTEHSVQTNSLANSKDIFQVPSDDVIATSTGTKASYSVSSSQSVIITNFAEKTGPDQSLISSGLKITETSVPVCNRMDVSSPVITSSVVHPVYASVDDTSTKNVPASCFNSITSETMTPLIKKEKCDDTLDHRILSADNKDNFNNQFLSNIMGLLKENSRMGLSNNTEVLRASEREKDMSEAYSLQFKNHILHKNFMSEELVSFQNCLSGDKDSNNICNMQNSTSEEIANVSTYNSHIPTNSNENIGYNVLKNISDPTPENDLSKANSDFNSNMHVYSEQNGPQNVDLHNFISDYLSRIKSHSTVDADCNGILKNSASPGNFNDDNCMKCNDSSFPPRYSTPINQDQINRTTDSASPWIGTENSSDSLQTHSSTVSFSYRSDFGNTENLSNYEKSMHNYFKYPFPGDSLLGSYKFRHKVKCKNYSRSNPLSINLSYDEVATKMRYAINNGFDTIKNISDLEELTDFHLVDEEIECYHRILGVAPSHKLISMCYKPDSKKMSDMEQENLPMESSVDFETSISFSDSLDFPSVAIQLDLLKDIKIFSQPEETFETNAKDNVDDLQNSELLVSDEFSYVSSVNNSKIVNEKKIGDSPNFVYTEKQTVAESECVSLSASSISEEMIFTSQLNSVPSLSEYSNNRDVFLELRRKIVNLTGLAQSEVKSDTNSIPIHEKIVESTNENNLVHVDVDNSSTNINTLNIAGDISDDKANSAKDNLIETLQMNVSSTNASNGNMDNPKNEIVDLIHKNDLLACLPIISKEMLYNVVQTTNLSTKQNEFTDAIDRSCATTSKSNLSNATLLDGMESSEHQHYVDVENKTSDSMCSQTIKETFITSSRNEADDMNFRQSEISNSNNASNFCSIDVPKIELLKILETANNLNFNKEDYNQRISSIEKVNYDYFNHDNNIEYGGSNFSSHYFNSPAFPNSSHRDSSYYRNNSPFLKIPIVHDYGHKPLTDSNIGIAVLPNDSKNLNSFKSNYHNGDSSSDTEMGNDSEFPLDSNIDLETEKDSKDDSKQRETKNAEATNSNLPQYKSRWEKIMERKAQEKTKDKLNDHLLKDYFSVSDKLSQGTLKNALSEKLPFLDSSKHINYKKQPDKKLIKSKKPDVINRKNQVIKNDTPLKRNAKSSKDQESSSLLSQKNSLTKDISTYSSKKSEKSSSKKNSSSKNKELNQNRDLPSLNTFKTSKNVNSPKKKLKTKSVVPNDAVSDLFIPDKVVKIIKPDKVIEKDSSKVYGRITNRGSFLTESTLNQISKIKVPPAKKLNQKKKNSLIFSDEIHSMVNTPEIKVSPATLPPATASNISVGLLEDYNSGRRNSVSNNSDFSLSPEHNFLSPSSDFSHRQGPFVANSTKFTLPSRQISISNNDPRARGHLQDLHSGENFLITSFSSSYEQLNTNHINKVPYHSPKELRISSPVFQSPSVTDSPFSYNSSSKDSVNLKSSFSSASQLPVRNVHPRPKQRLSKCICLPSRHMKDSVGRSVFETINVLLLILEWNVDWLFQQRKNSAPPPISKSVYKVINSYDNFENYYNTYFPLLLFETWHRIYVSWNHLHSAAPYICEITSYVEEKTSVNVECQTIFSTIDTDRGLFPEEGNIIMVKFGTKGKGGIKILGYITHVKVRAVNPSIDSQSACYQMMKSSPSDHLQLLQMTFLSAYTSEDFDKKMPIRVHVLCNVKTNLKQNDALLKIKSSPLKKNVLNPLEDELRVVNMVTRNSDEEDKISTCVREIVKGILSPHPIPIITIVKSSPSSDRLLVLPPLVKKMKDSFGTKVLLCARTTKGLIDIGLNLDENNINIGITGKRADVPQKLKKYLIEDLAISRALTLQLNEGNIQEDAVCRDNLKPEVLMKARKLVLTECDVILSLIRNCHDNYLEEAFADEDTVSQMCCIIDEANLCTEPEILIPLLFRISKLILIGDPDVLAKVCSKTASSFGYSKSLFHRAYELDLISE